MERLDGLRNFFVSTPTSMGDSQMYSKGQVGQAGSLRLAAMATWCAMRNRNARRDRISRSL